MTSDPTKSLLFGQVLALVLFKGDQNRPATLVLLVHGAKVEQSSDLMLNTLNVAWL